MKIQAFKKSTAAHYQLLLDADPSKSMIDDYLPRSHCFEAIVENQLTGVIILLPTRPETFEIVNIAVAEPFQGQGIGRKLIQHAIQYGRKRNITTLEIGTGSTSFGQLYLYQKCGFRMTSIDKDFFTRHYTEEIIENDLLLKDMVRLSQDL